MNRLDLLKNMTWQGYQRQNGTQGIRNKILVIYTVECAHFVADKIVAQINDPEVEVVGFSGCTDNEYAVRMLISLIRHPNVGAVLAVGLGCEYIQPEWLSNIAREEGKPSGWFFIQQAGGTKSSVVRGVENIREMKTKLASTPRSTMGFNDLIIGSECGGSDYTSGLAGNVAVGNFYDWLVDAGGTAIFEEIVEAIGLLDLLSSRAASDSARSEIVATYNKALEYCKSVRQYSVSPGNFAGGLSTIEEKSMGAVIKSGSRPIQGVLKVSGKPKHKGLWLLDSTPDPHWMQFGITNPNDNEGLMDLISCGSHIIFFVTGRGSVVGSAVAPVIKLTGNSQTYENMIDDMDVDAGRVLSGDISQDELSAEIAELVMAIARGKMSKSEEQGHKEYFIPYKYQSKEVLIPLRCES
ncbi:UxaA family hydrolase [Enterobacteriaceae bacterium H11S18]|uniref:UxaA family hydrolase n=1 Tax=Dryocola clanedunensis TaxID=2925396 RepID=UPI0022F02B0A|nr:UxaA family hydrolase [Dryocola clanedunensis]MCT4706500.1 UxaA family hydrolase [Dryocola clanedunensis]MCT4713311.1 UxaA family hydrolase [Dryocola clanedunensis]